MIGALGEIVGAAAVVVTLGYLAGQVRQAKLASQQQTVAEVLDQNQAILMWLSSSPDNASLYRRGLAGDATLSADEVLSVAAIFYSLSLLWNRTHELEQSQGIETWFTAVSRETRRDLIGSPGYRAWYESRKAWLSPSFRAELESEMQKARPYEPPRISQE